MMEIRKKATAFLPLVLVSGVLAATVLTADSALAEDMDKVYSKAEARQDKAAAGQQKIDQLDDQIRKNLQEYKALSKEVEGLEIYTDQLKRQISAQQEEMDNIRASIEQTTIIERNIMPLMLKMVAGLEQFIALDIPFDIDKRRARVENLKGLLDRSDVTVAEKYRKVLEAYQEEMEYGRTIDGNRGQLDLNGQDTQVDFLRVGRVAYLYSTLDAERQGFWNKETGQWEDLDGSYRASIVQGLRIAREQAAPDLIRVPVPGAVAAGEQ